MPIWRLSTGSRPSTGWWGVPKRHPGTRLPRVADHVAVDLARTETDPALAVAAPPEATRVEDHPVHALVCALDAAIIRGMSGSARVAVCLPFDVAGAIRGVLVDVWTHGLAHADAQPPRASAAFARTLSALQQDLRARAVARLRATHGLRPTAARAVVAERLTAAGAILDADSLPRRWSPAASLARLPAMLGADCLSGYGLGPELALMTELETGSAALTEAVTRHQQTQRTPGRHTTVKR